MHAAAQNLDHEIGHAAEVSLDVAVQVKCGRGLVLMLQCNAGQQKRLRSAEHGVCGAESHPGLVLVHVCIQHANVVDAKMVACLTELRGDALQVRNVAVAEL